MDYLKNTRAIMKLDVELEVDDNSANSPQYDLTKSLSGIQLIKTLMSILSILCIKKFVMIKSNVMFIESYTWLPNQT